MSIDDETTMGQPQQQEEQPPQEEQQSPTTTNNRGGRCSWFRCWCCYCCGDWWKFQGICQARGFSFATFGNGNILISNIFFGTAIIYLASDAAGCISPTTGAILRNCPTRVYGFYPASFVTTIYTIASLASAFFMPFVGALMDSTPYRRKLGTVVATLLWMIQTVQIGTNERTWFAMAVLQAIAGVLFEFHFLLSVSYLPDIVRYHTNFAEQTFHGFNRTFYALQFGGQAAFLLIMVLITRVIYPQVIAAMSDSDGGSGTSLSVTTGRIGQGISSITLLIVFPLAWKFFPESPPKHPFPVASTTSARTKTCGTTGGVCCCFRLLWQGFQQNYYTAKAIVKHHKPLQWFLTTVALSEAGNSTLVPVVITTMTQIYRFDASYVSIMFFISLMSALPGIVLGTIVSKRFNPQIAHRVVLALLTVGTLGAVFVMRRTARWQEEHMADDEAGRPQYSGYLLGFMWGCLLGWFFTTQQLYFSASVPPKQETELSGFYVYCTIILTWVPTLMGSFLLEFGMNAEMLLLPLVGFQFLSFVSACCCPNWTEVMEKAKDPLPLPYILQHQDTTSIVIPGESSTEDNPHSQQTQEMISGTMQTPRDPSNVDVENSNQQA